MNKKNKAKIPPNVIVKSGIAGPVIRDKGIKRNKLRS